MLRTPRRSGFTMIELLTMSAAVVLLSTVLLGCMGEAREAARRSQCKNNLKQIGLALHNYHDTFNRLPMGWTGVDVQSQKSDVFGMNGWGWYSKLLPFLEQQSIYSRIDFNKSVTDPGNAQIFNVAIKELRCPSDGFTKATWTLKDAAGTAIAEVSTSNYVASFGTGSVTKCETWKTDKGDCLGDGLFYHNRCARFRDVTDGTSNTLAVGERAFDEKADRMTTWSGVFPTAKTPFSRILADSEQPINGTNSSGYGSVHKGGSHFLLLDGEVRFIAEKLDPKVFKILTTPSGGEQIPQENTKPKPN